MEKHTVEFVKRQAKKLKREKGISHVQALEEVAKSLGFSSYQDFLNKQ